MTRLFVHLPAWIRDSPTFRAVAIGCVCIIAVGLTARYLVGLYCAALDDLDNANHRAAVAEERAEELEADAAILRPMAAPQAGEAIADHFRSAAE